MKWSQLLGRFNRAIVGHRILRDDMIAPIYVCPNDTIQATYSDGIHPQQVLTSTEFTRAMRVNRIVIHENDGFMGSEKCIGVSFLEMK